MASRKNRLVSLTTLACSLPLAMIPSMATAGTLSSITTVSGPSPFAGSTIGGPGTNFVNGEVEPWVDVNPTNTSNIVGAWQQDRWDNGGAHGLVAGYSFDGGKTWGETPLPFTSSAPGGLNYERASDPWVSFGPDGTLYTISISFNQSNNDNCVATAVSHDGGKTWTNVNVLKADLGTYQYFNDKEEVTADPTKAGVAYAVWDRLESPNANPYADTHAMAYTGPSYFAKTTDGGKTWSPARVIVNTTQNSQTIGNQIVVDPRTGTLYDFMDLIQTTTSNTVIPHGENLAFIKSTDGGNTWTQPQVITTMNTVAVTDPNTGAELRTGDDLPEPAIDPNTGKIYVVWQDGRFSNGAHADVALTSSADGGATWSTPVPVNGPNSQQAFNPSVRVNAAGVVGVTYYDFRNLLPGNTTTLPTDVWFTSSANGGQTFDKEMHLSGSFDMLYAPNAEGYFLGDYQGMATVANTFYPFYAQANTGNASNPSDIFFTKVTP